MSCRTCRSLPPTRSAADRPPGLYGDVVEEIDWSVGQILDAIQRCGIERETLVMFFSDNGPFLSYGNHAGSAKPLREGKLTTFEGGVRVPFHRSLARKSAGRPGLR
jgi:arylsulfatase A-like enzyme